MISRHVDLIAIGLLLLVLAFCTQVRRAGVLEISSRRIGFTKCPNGSFIVIPPQRPPAPVRFISE